MTAPMRNSHPLPPMDETTDDAVSAYTDSSTVGEAGVVGAPPHSIDLLQPMSPMKLGAMSDAEFAAWIGELRARTAEMAKHRSAFGYVASRRAHAEAIGRPYPKERHPVWPR